MNFWVSIRKGDKFGRVKFLMVVSANISPTSASTFLMVKWLWYFCSILELNSRSYCSVLIVDAFATGVLVNNNMVVRIVFLSFICVVVLLAGF